MADVPENIINKTLYKKVKEDAKKKFKRFPSLYASSWISREYMKRGGKYKSKKDENEISGQKQWYKEEWIQIVPYLEENIIIKCGDDNKDTKACRASKRVNKIYF